MKISMKLVYQYMVIFFNFSPTSTHLHPLQVENCDSNSRLVVDGDDNGKFRLERVKHMCMSSECGFTYNQHLCNHSHNSVAHYFFILSISLYLALHGCDAAHYHLLGILVYTCEEGLFSDLFNVDKHVTLMNYCDRPLYLFLQ